MSAQAALRSALKESFGPVARAHGFRGTAPTWRKSNGHGDWAIVNVQSSAWNTADDVLFTVNLSGAPAPWLRRSPDHVEGRAVRAYHGMFQDRLTPSAEHVGEWWTVTDQASADASVGDVLAVLEGDRGWALLDDLLERGRFLRHVESGDLGMVRREWGYETYFDLAEIALRIDRGPSAELTRAVESVRAAGTTADPDFATTFEQWLRAESARL